MIHEIKNLIKTKICIVGLGPSGIAAAFTFLKHGLAEDLVGIDAGNYNRNCPVLFNQKCKKIKSCRVISGLGGGSLFCEKISYFPAGSGLVNIIGSKEKTLMGMKKALKLIYQNISAEDTDMTNKNIEEVKEYFFKLGFRYKYYDVYTFSPKELRKKYHDIISSLVSGGARIFFGTRMVDVEIEKDHFVILAEQSGRNIIIHTDYLVIGIGRLGVSLLKKLNSKFRLGGKENKLEVGVRIEFPTRLFPEIDKYHKDLKLLFKDARTFCLSKNGKIALYNIDGVCFTEGFVDSEYPTDLTNIGILLRLKSLNNCEKNKIIYEIKKRSFELTKGKPGVQVLDEYLSMNKTLHEVNLPFKPSISYWERVNIENIFPILISEKIKNAVYYFANRLFPQNYWKNIVVFAPEIHYAGPSFPVKSDFSIIPKMYLIGEGTGRFRGILQSFVSGMVCADNIIGEINDEK